MKVSLSGQEVVNLLADAMAEKGYIPKGYKIRDIKVTHNGADIRLEEVKAK